MGDEKITTKKDIQLICSPGVGRHLDIYTSVAVICLGLVWDRAVCVLSHMVRVESQLVGAICKYSGVRCRSDGERTSGVVYCNVVR